MHLTGSRATGKDLEQNGGLLGQSNMAPNLEDLSLADNRKLASTGLAVLLGSLDCTHLTSLDLSGTNLKLSGIQSLNSHQADKVGGARLLRLRRLGLGNTRLKDMEVNILINKTDGTVLEELDLGGTNVTLEEAHRLKTNKFPNLAKLSLAKATRVTDIGLIGFINRLVGSALTELDLTGTRLALAEAGSLVNTLPRLRLLNLADCTQVTDRGLVALLNRLDGGRLEVLDLRCTCINLTEAAGGGLTNKLTGLKQLHLRGCEHVSDRGIFGLLNAIDGSRLALIDLCFTTVSLSEAGLLTNRLPGLTRLLLSCESLTDRGLQLLFTRLDGCCLQELDLSFTNVAFNFVATGDNGINNLPALMMLDLTGCKAVEGERLLTFLKQVGCVGLCELRVGQTDRVVAWEQITENFPSLKIVY